jgi:Domain of unknown function (DUF6795)
MALPRFFLITIIFSLSFATEGWGMGLFDFMKIYMASEFNGVVTLEGKPLQGVKVIRTVDDDEKITTQTTETDAEGRFYFDAVIKHSLIKFVPIEPRYYQKVFITHEGKEFLGLDMAKGDYAENGEIWKKEGGELIDLPLNFSCELTDGFEKILMSGQYLDGICRLIKD